MRRAALALALGAAVAVGGSCPSPRLTDAANNPRRPTPLPPAVPDSYRGRSVVRPTTAPGQSARRARRLARHGKTV